MKVTPLISAGTMLAAILSAGAALAAPASAATITPLAGTDLGAASYSLAAGTTATFQVQYWNTARRFESVDVKGNRQVCGRQPIIDRAAC